MLHSDWFALAGVQAAALQDTANPSVPAASSAPPASVVGLPSGGQPAAPTNPATGVPAPAPGAARPVGPDSSFLWIIGGAFILMIGLPMITGRGERKRRAAMMSKLGKGDKVLMSGGLIGVVSEMAENEVVLRVEEGKVRYSKASVQQVLQSANS